MKKTKSQYIKDLAYMQRYSFQIVKNNNYLFIVFLNQFPFIKSYYYYIIIDHFFFSGCFLKIDFSLYVASGKHLTKSFFDFYSQVSNNHP